MTENKHHGQQCPSCVQLFNSWACTNLECNNYEPLKEPAKKPLTFGGTISGTSVIHSKIDLLRGRDCDNELDNYNEHIHRCELPFCDQPDPTSAVTCTKVNGHASVHVAHMNNKPFAVWS